MRRLSLAALLIACGTGAPLPAPPDAGATRELPAADYASGSRLRAETYRDEDGHAVWHGWFDAQLGMECVFDVAEDGLPRCLPRPGDYDIVYSDASCSMVKAVANTFGLAPPKGYVLAKGPCRGHGVYVPDPDTLVGGDFYAFPSYDNSPGNTCKSVSATQAFLYSITQHVPPSTFVGASIVTKPGDDELASRVLVAEDGAYLTLYGNDRTRGVDCQTSAAYRACIPLTRAMDNTPSCPGAWVGLACPNDSPPAAATIFKTICTAQTVSMSSDTCVVDGQPMLVAGPGYTAPAISVADRGSGRLRLRWATSASGTPIRVIGFYDSLLDITCHAEGGRCVPDAHYVNESPGRENDCSGNAIFATSDCGLARYVKGWGHYFVRSAPLEASASICNEQYLCNCFPYDGTTPMWTTTVADDTFALLSDVTE